MDYPAFFTLSIVTVKVVPAFMDPLTLNVMLADVIPQFDVFTILSLQVAVGSIVNVGGNII